MSKYKSRRKTPWEGKVETTATQKFLKQHYDIYYKERHRKVNDSNEADMINAYIPTKCCYCKSEKLKKNGRTKSGIQRYMCGDCGKTFLPTTGTIFDEHRISISEWTEYCMNIFHHVRNCLELT